MITSKAPILWAIQRVPDVKKVKRTIIKNNLNELKICDNLYYLLTTVWIWVDTSIFDIQNVICRWC